MNVTPVTSTENDGEELVNNEEAQATPTQETSNGSGTTEAVEPTNSTTTAAPPVEEGATVSVEGAASPADAGDATTPALDTAPEGAVEVEAPKADENAAPVSLMEQLLNENESASSVRRLE